MPSIKKLITFDSFSEKVKLRQNENENVLKELYESEKLMDWMGKLHRNFGWENVKEVNVEYIRRFHDGSIGFIVVEAELTVTGKKIPGTAFLRGQSCSILIILKIEQEVYVLLTKQPRLPTGDYVLEIPAGMVEKDDVVTTGLKELEEEACINVDSINKLRHEPIYLSPGGMDEEVFLYYLELEVTKEELKRFQDCQTGLRDQGELIELQVYTLKEAKKCVKDAKSLISFYLYENLSKNHSQS